MVSLTAHHLARRHPATAPELYANTSWQRSHRRGYGSRATAVVAVVVTASRARRAGVLGRNGRWARPAGHGLGPKNQPITVYMLYNIISNLKFPEIC
jgi:hypothetical protein